jgi:hypothetical protein
MQQSGHLFFINPLEDLLEVISIVVLKGTLAEGHVSCRENGISKQPSDVTVGRRLCFVSSFL